MINKEIQEEFIKVADNFTFIIGDPRSIKVKDLLLRIQSIQKEVIKVCTQKN